MTAPSSDTLLIATRNSHKVGEIRAILGKAFHYATLDDCHDAPGAVEDAETFAGNAAKKAASLARWMAGQPHSHFSFQVSRAFILADDSGLEVDALNGAPGVHSARFAALDTGAPGNSSDAANNSKLLRLLEGTPLEKRTARFRCAIALVPAGDGPESESPELFEGVCEGHIGLSPRGRGGFGYDPLFVPNGFKLSFSELGEDVKNCLSHRAKALAKLKTRLAAPR